MMEIFANITSSQQWEFNKEDEMFADSPTVSFSYPSGKYFSLGYNLDMARWFVFYAKDEDDLRGTVTSADSVDDALNKLASKYHEHVDPQTVGLLRQETSKLLGINI